MTKLEPRDQDNVMWQGRPSQWTNFWPFVLCILIIPIPYAIYRYLKLRCTTFTMTHERLRLAQGILSRKFDDLELYRVKDTSLSQSFIERLLGLGTIHLTTSDASHPHFKIPTVSDSQAVHDTLRDQVEKLRRERGVREFDVT